MTSLRAAVALCQRQSRDASPQVAQQLWLQVLRIYVAQLRKLRAEQPAESAQPAKLKQAHSADGRLAWPLPGVV